MGSHNLLAQAIEAEQQALLEHLSSLHLLYQPNSITCTTDTH
ncbi:hypothetical protein [Vibrio hippocampi]|nr:hypothetical protein [Vibrio hippocampi]